MKTEIVPHCKRLTLDSMPERMKVQAMELDLTWDCNLECVYCYKGERHQVAISKRVAFDAVTWLLYASAHTESISLFFMGGEPLLQFELMKQLVPFARRRSKQQGKNLFISTTTNCTLVTNEVLEFFKKWNVGLHTSIDGVPDVQNHNRPFCNGGETSTFVTKNIPAILKYRPNTTARATVIPENVDLFSDNYLYFRKLGYTNIAMIPSNYTQWDSNALQKFEEQLRCTAELWKNDLRRGEFVSVSFFSSNTKEKKMVHRSSIPCGAGRELVSVDVYGDIWPCNRWNTHCHHYWNQWKLGNIYSGFSEEARLYFIKGNSPAQKCENCQGQLFCGGGCHASNIDSTGDIRFIHENACQLYCIQAGIALDLHDDLYTEKCPAFMKHYYPEEWKKTNSSIISGHKKEENYVSCDS